MNCLVSPPLCLLSQRKYIPLPKWVVFFNYFFPKKRKTKKRVAYGGEGDGDGGVSEAWHEPSKKYGYSVDMLSALVPTRWDISEDIFERWVWV